MSDNPNVRQERIHRLLHELRYEVERGMLERDVDEYMTFRFYVPISRNVKDGVVFCEFRTVPVPRHCMSSDAITPRLKIVK